MSAEQRKTASDLRASPSVDVVVVSYNSAEHLRACVEPLAALPDVRVIVVDNASRDASLAVVSDLAVTTIARSTNDGFAAGCNAGWRAGSSPYVLFLNPDATIEVGALRRLCRTLDQGERVGAVAPRIEFPDGSRADSLRRFPRLRSTFAQALFLHRAFPSAAWTNEVIRDPAAYTEAWTPEWASGACILVRRSLLELLGGWDEEFFLYCEDVDLCRRLREAGHQLVYQPHAVVVHQEGASSSRPTALPLLTAARLLYARKHRAAIPAAIERAGVALWALTRLVTSTRRPADRQGNARALRIALSGDDRWRPTNS